MILLISVFVIGYLAIIFEEKTKVNKAAVALVMGCLCWTIYALTGHAPTDVHSSLAHHFAEISEILFFLLGAMTIVELMDAHDAFDVLVERIKTRDKKRLLWLIGFLSFFLSAILDNLTTTIVMVSFLRKLTDKRADKLFFSSIIVIAANAGGAWSPIGDVTTTMLWVGGQVTTMALIKWLFLPSLVCLIAPLALLTPRIKGVFAKDASEDDPLSADSILASKYQVSERHKVSVFVLGLCALIFVPIFKSVTHLPPFMGMLLALGVLWVILEKMHKEKDEEIRHSLTPLAALQRIDTPSILFFAGILLAVSVLQEAQILRGCAAWLSQVIGNQTVIAILIGLLSAVVDNVPLVAATMGMYDLTAMPPDHFFWHLIAFCAGTGGSLLIIGSAAGVAAMGMERIDFIWYVKKITLLAAVGYAAGVVVFILEKMLFSI